MRVGKVKLRSSGSPAPFARARDRVVPAHAGKSRKVDVGGMHDRTMSESERGKLRITREVPSHSRNAQQPKRCPDIIGVRIKSVCYRLLQPFLHMCRRFIKGERLNEGSGICADPHKGKENRWTESDRLLARKQSGPPLCRLRIKRTRGIIGARQETFSP
jgi:hypothetical protein